MSTPSGFTGRLGLASADIPHVDRHGLLWVQRGKLYVESGTVRFLAAQSDLFAAGDYAIPYQTVSMILAGPGTTITHDVLRILASHGTLLAAVGEGGVKFYTAPPMGRGRSDIARTHARLWADEERRLDVARRMYAIRFGEVLPHRDISALRGTEGARVREGYQLLARKYRIEWRGRRYDRQHPDSADVPNQAINHVSTFVEAAADIAVAAVGALPPLGFIHEESSNAFTLDVADLWRMEVTVPVAFAVAAKVDRNPGLKLEREARYQAAAAFRQRKLIPEMIDQIKGILGIDDSHRSA